MVKKVIYTCLVGNYDDLEEPLYIMDGWDYICFSNDVKTKNNSVWQIQEIPFECKNKILLSRYAKLLPHKVLFQYHISIYIDSNIRILTNKLENRINKLILNNTNIAIAKHPERNCLYEEALKCKEIGLDNEEMIDKQIKFYREAGFPENFGLYENNIIYRQHNQSQIIDLNNQWWKLLNEFSKRDQLSLVYLFWKNKLKCTDLFEEGFNVRKNEGFQYKHHNPNLRMKLKRKLKVLKKQIKF